MRISKIFLKKFATIARTLIQLPSDRVWQTLWVSGINFIPIFPSVTLPSFPGHVATLKHAFI
nr:MAG TPA: hypothetical protein [Caudoviricetes sp.]